MNASTSDYSSGCESGWTMYLDQISNSDALYTKYQDKGGYHDDDDDEDQSMVSDASSGPPPLPHASEDKKKRADTKTRKEPNQKHALCLDDTASSSIFHFSQDNVPPSDDSAAHFEGESVTKKRLSFFKSSTKGKSGSVVGRKRQ
ncbi:protein SOB FIVE-LIKE 5-like isoform X2 [Salvia miltiorrhiza]|uniref:protein SOB FIVE-LIKE 5-like isoform X2 n=1 Tax=Salvia miltiorrhiza TaxID=226208 RepID=UPI0025AC8D89|nr:protein SOB FIVE-LIKE 5-like isoform X2 [Salvia miltiorrhiza]